MFSSRNGSASGCSPARNARARSGSPYPRRTSTLAVISLRPSAWARRSACRCGHGLIVQVPSDIGDYGRRGVGQHRTARRALARPRRHLPQSRLVRRLLACGVRALSGVAARAGARAGALPRAAHRGAARGSAGQARRRCRCRSRRPGLRPERDLRREHRRVTWEHVCGDFGARYVPTPVPLPIGEPGEIVETIWAGVNERTRVLYLSHHTSGTALTLPVPELCRRARERGIVTVIDGAHMPGHLPLNLRELDPDFYAGTCHKWLCAPKGAGFLYVRRELQRDVHPLVFSWGYKGDDPSFLARHEEQGTRDPSAYLTVAYAIEWQQSRAWHLVRERCHGLARRAAVELGLTPVVPDTQHGCYGQMVSLQLPGDCRPTCRSACSTSTTSRSP